MRSIHFLQSLISLFIIPSALASQQLGPYFLDYYAQATADLLERNAAENKTVCKLPRRVPENYEEVSHLYALFLRYPC